MTKVILDTGILITYPAILSRSSSQTRFIIPDVALDELSVFAEKNKEYRQIIELIKNGSGNIHIGVTEKNKLKVDPQFAGSGRMSFADHLIADFAIKYYNEHQNERVYVATEDKSLSSYCRTHNVETLNLQALRALILLPEKKNIAIDTAVKKINIFVIKDFSLHLGVSLICGVLANLLYSKLNTIIKTINVWGTIAIIPVLGILLFLIRSKWRLIYGLTEFLIGFSAAIRVFLPNFDYTQLHPSEMFQIIGGLYIIVRGLDNIDKGIENTKYQLLWGKFFH
jgi:rRNA-processing protein FCF1